MKHGISCLLLLLVCGCKANQEQAKWSTRGESVIQSGSPALQQAPVPRMEVLDETVRVSAVDLLMQASRSEDPLLRMYAIEGLQPVDEQLDEVVRFGMIDDNEGVRFAAVFTVGKQELCTLSHLVRPLLEDPSPSVRAAAMFSLDRCGQDVDLSPLAGMVLGNDPTAKANAAVVLAELGNASAVPLIRSGVGQGMGQVEQARVQTIELSMAEALVRLGDDTQLEVIRAALFSPSERGELTAMACQILGQIGDTVMVQNLQDLATAQGPREPGIEIRLVASEALARIEPNRVPLDFILQQTQHPEAEIRAQAAIVLGTLDSARFGPQLAVLLRDQDPRVQIAAAAAALRKRPATVVQQGNDVY